MFRIGFGHDVHPLEKGNTIRLGGIDIPSDYKAKGHSDADVLIHAICDAILGGLALGDIGSHFPDSDMKYKNIDSRILLRKVYALMKKRQFTIRNIDCTVCLESPKIAEYTKAMRYEVANILETTAENISIKATTNEKLGFVGVSQGITAYAVVLIMQDWI